MFLRTFKRTLSGLLKLSADLESLVALTDWARAAAVVILARPSKRPRHDVWCAGIVLHASSLLSRPAAQSQRGGMCRPRERGAEKRIEWPVKAAGNLKSADEFICLRVACYLDTGSYSRRSPFASGLCGLARRRHTGHIRTHSLWLWVNIFLHLMPDCSAGRSSGMDERELGVLELPTGATRSIFSDRPQSGTDFGQLVPWLYWLKTTPIAIKN